MNRLRWIGVCVVVGVLGVLIYVLFLSTPISYDDILEDEFEMNEGKEDTIISGIQQGTVQEGHVDDGVYDPVQAYHNQVRAHAAGNRFEGIYLLYKQNNDLQLLSALIDAGLQTGEYEVVREELMAVGVDDLDVVRTIGPEKILKTLYTITPLHIKSYDSLKRVVDIYKNEGLITPQRKAFWYSLVALSKGHTHDFEEFIKESGDTYRLEVIQSVHQTVDSYQYAPSNRSLGLYGVAMYNQGWYRVSHALSVLLQKEFPEYQLGYQLGARSNLQLHEWERAEKLAQQAMRLDTVGQYKDQYLLIEAIAVYNQSDYARSLLLFNQLDTSQYKEQATRYRFKIALKTKTGLEHALKKLPEISMQLSDWYEVVSLLYPPFERLSDQAMNEIASLVQQCQRTIEPSYSYICIMGKAGELRNEGEVEKSMIVLRQITQQYPTSHAWELLGETYIVIGEEKLAKEAFLEALRFSQDENEQIRILPRIQGLMSDN